MIRSPRRALATLTAVAATAALAACGTTETDDSAAGAPSDAAALSDSCAQDTTTTSTEPVSVTDDLGRTVELDGPAERVAVLEWQQVEDALTLCVAPVAVADVEGFGHLEHRRDPARGHGRRRHPRRAEPRRPRGGGSGPDRRRGHR